MIDIKVSPKGSDKTPIVNEIHPPCLNTVKRGLFGTKYSYLDEKTRVRYGYTFIHLGITYTLQRKGVFWNNVAWTYPILHIGQSLDEIVGYLKWYERDKIRSSF